MKREILKKSAAFVCHEPAPICSPAANRGASSFWRESCLSGLHRSPISWFTVGSGTAGCSDAYVDRSTDGQSSVAVLRSVSKTRLARMSTASSVMRSVTGTGPSRPIKRLA